MRSEQSPLSPEDVSLVPETFVLISFLFTSTTERVVPTIEQISFVAERVPFASAPSTTAVVHTGGLSGLEGNANRPPNFASLI
jgi:hypothetical protein